MPLAINGARQLTRPSSEAYRYLKALQEPKECHRIPNEIAGLFMLATKYDFSCLQTILKDALMKAWPVALKDRDQGLAIIAQHNLIPPDPGMLTSLLVRSIECLCTDSRIAVIHSASHPTRDRY